MVELVTEKSEIVSLESDLEKEANEVSIFTKHLQNKKDDFKFVTSVRREVIQLIEPFRLKNMENSRAIEEFRNDLGRFKIRIEKNE